MKKILFILMLIISIPKLNSINLKKINEEKFLLQINEDTTITENLEIDGDLLIIGKDVIINVDFLMTHKKPILTFEKNAEIKITGTLYLQDIMIPELNKIKSKIKCFMP